MPKTNKVSKGGKRQTRLPLSKSAPPEMDADLERSASPEPRVTPAMRLKLDSLLTFVECSGQKILLNRERTNYFEHVFAFVALLALAAFLAFVLWFGFYTKAKISQELEEETTTEAAIDFGENHDVDPFSILRSTFQERKASERDGRVSYMNF